jgi:NADH-quinone oxidoreductase subunit G
VVIETEKQILLGREKDRKKISMQAIPLKKDEIEAFKEGNV